LNRSTTSAARCWGSAGIASLAMSSHLRRACEPASVGQHAGQIVSVERSSCGRDADRHGGPGRGEGRGRASVRCRSSLTGCGRRAGPRLPCPPHGEKHTSIGARQYRARPFFASEARWFGTRRSPPLPCRDTWPDQPCRAERPRRHPGQGQGFIRHEHAAVITVTSSGRPPAEPCTLVSRSCCGRRQITTSTSAPASPSRISTPPTPGTGLRASQNEDHHGTGQEPRRIGSQSITPSGVTPGSRCSRAWAGCDSPLPPAHDVPPCEGNALVHDAPGGLRVGRLPVHNVPIREGYLPVVHDAP
jgi:hypothetical protein